METSITDNIIVSVSHEYKGQFSDPERHDHVFFYRVNIENLGSSKVRLLQRHFELLNCNGTITEILGTAMDVDEFEISPGQSAAYDIVAA